MAIKLNPDAIGFNPNKAKEKGRKFDAVLVGPFEVDVEKGTVKGILHNPPKELAHLKGKPVEVVLRKSADQAYPGAPFQGNMIDARMKKAIAQKKIQALVIEGGIFYPNSDKVVASWINLEPTLDRIRTGPVSATGRRTEDGTVVYGIQVWNELLIGENDKAALDSLKQLLDKSAAHYWDAIKQFEETGEWPPTQPSVGFSIFAKDAQTGHVVGFIPAQLNHLSSVYNEMANDIKDEKERSRWRFSPPSHEELEAFMEVARAKFPGTVLSIAYCENFQPSRASQQAAIAVSRLVDRPVPIGIDEDGSPIFTQREPATVASYGVLVTGTEGNYGWANDVKANARVVPLPEAFPGLTLDPRLKQVYEETLAKRGEAQVGAPEKSEDAEKKMSPVVDKDEDVADQMLRELSGESPRDDRDHDMIPF